MPVEPTCPRCVETLRAPGLWSSDWQCARHGTVAPYTVLTHLGHDAVEHVAGHTTVPLWLPHGLAGTWLITGLAFAGDERTGALATVTCLSGPSPLDGGCDLLLIAEQPGVGLGARYAGLDEPDPGPQFDVGAPDARVIAAGHPTALWSVPGDDDRAVFLGEAKGLWLWVIVSPGNAGILMYDELSLLDARDGLDEPGLDFGSVSPLLAS